MTDLQEQLRSTVNEIRSLESQLDAAPDLDAAVQLAGHYEVARRLASKVEEADKAAELDRQERETAALSDRYEGLADQLEDLYGEVAKALRVVLDRSEEAFLVKNEVRRLWGMLERRGARPGPMPDSFWPRDRQLRDDFTESVLRNGEP